MIYVITKGEYSDYHICAVATTYENAEYLRKMYCDSYQDAEIEAFTPDVPDDTFYNPSPTGYWRINFKANGELDGQPEFYFDKPNLEIEISRARFSFDLTLTVHNIKAEQPAEAFKIACDVRAKYLAEQLGL